MANLVISLVDSIVSVGVVAVRTIILTLWYISVCNCILFKEEGESAGMSTKAVLVLGFLTLFIA